MGKFIQVLFVNVGLIAKKTSLALPHTVPVPNQEPVVQVMTCF